MKKSLFALLGLVISTTLFAADYVVSIPAGTTNVIDSALVAELGSSTRLVKRGLGVLRSTSAMRSYPGEIVVEEGVLYLTEASSLGTSAKGTTIADGASLVMNFASACDYKAEEFIIAGNGASGEGGALVNLGAGMSGNMRYITLNGDARIYAYGEMGLYAGRLDMNGHTLSIAVRNRDSNGRTTWDYSFIFNRSRVTNPGHIIFETGRLAISGRTLSDGTAVWYGDASNTLTLKRGTKLMYGNSLTYIPWTLITEDSTGIYANGNVDVMAPTNNAWMGPVKLLGELSLGYNKNAGHISFGGDISGSGTLSWNGLTPIHLWSESSLTGGLVANGVNASDAIPLYLHAGKTMSPLNSKGITLIDANLPLIADEAYELPVLKIDNSASRSISGGSKGGTATGIVKNGAGVLTYNARVDVTGTIHLVSGQLTWPVKSIREQVGGLRFGECNFDSDSYSSPGANYYWSNYSSTYPETVEVVDSVGYAYVTKQPLWASKYAMARYEGYIWNDSDHDVTWSFMSGVQNRGRIFINGKQLFDQYSYQRAAFAKATLKPGANKIVISMFFAPTTSGGGGGSTLSQVIDFDGTLYSSPLDNPSTADFKWILLKGCAYNTEGTDSHDEKDYQKFENLSDGSVITTTDNFEGLSPIAAANINTLIGEAGATFDLANRAAKITIPRVSGCCTIANCIMTIGEKLVVRVVDVEKGDKLVTSNADLLFADDAIVEVDDVRKLDKLRHTDNPYVIATTDGVFTTLPTVAPSLEEKGWNVRLSADAKALELYRKPSGIMLILR